MKIKASITAMILMGVSTGAWAAGDDDAEATIRLMGTAEAELPDAVTKQISLPKDLIDAEDQVAAVERAKKGHDKANERHDRRKDGLSKADAARERGAEMSEKTKETRENRGRAEDERPDPPNRPDNPGPPDNPGRS